MPGPANFESVSDMDPIPVFRKGCRPSVVSTIMEEDGDFDPNSGSLSDIRKSSITTQMSGVDDSESRRGSSVTPHKDKFQILVLGAARVGKTALIHQFLYDQFPDEYRATVEQLHRGEYEVKGDLLTLEILDTSGYYYFPAMRRLEIAKADAVLLIYAVDDQKSFEEVRHLRELVTELRPGGVPTVVVGNKCDLNARRIVRAEIAETVTLVDWEAGYVECSAKMGTRVIDVFKEVLNQSQIQYALSPAVKRRRKSLPVQNTQPRLKSAVALKRNSCTVS